MLAERRPDWWARICGARGHLQLDVVLYLFSHYAISRVPADGSSPSSPSRGLKLLRLQILRLKFAKNAHLLSCKLRFFANFCLVSAALATL
jgi:hypothetical protein